MHQNIKKEFNITQLRKNFCQFICHPGHNYKSLGATEEYTNIHTLPKSLVGLKMKS